MKPAPFLYVAPETEDELFALMRQHGADARPLAGGQSLVPMMNFRVAAPIVLVDMNRLPGWSYLRPSADHLEIGALTRYSTIEDSEMVGADWSVVAEGVRNIAHRAIRNRGTIGGSIALAYPGAEFPLLCVALNAVVQLRSHRGARAVPAHEFFVGELSTLLDDDEVVSAVHIPRLPKGARSAFCEVTRRHGDFAIAASAAVLDVDGAGNIRGANIGASSGTGEPKRLTTAEHALAGHRPSKDLFSGIARDATRQLEIGGDLHYPAEYRRAVLEGTIRTALETAQSRAEHCHVG